jgi:equilibrative nucleoside transporter 1/2/3
VLKKVFPYGFSVFLVFAVTIGLFPGTVALIRSTYNNRCSPKEGCELDSQLLWTGALFTPLVCFLMFNVSDFVGRTLSNWFTQPKHWIPLLLSCLLRFIYFPLFALCFIPGTRFHAVFTYDAIPVIICALFGITNGYLASIAMVHSPSRVPIIYSETASVIAGAFLTTGLATGAGLSAVFVKIIRNPDYV